MTCTVRSARDRHAGNPGPERGRAEPRTARRRPARDGGKDARPRVQSGA
nr:MAG TPA: hypothetical protein [Caudoviricetes sp.]